MEATGRMVEVIKRIKIHKFELYRSVGSLNVLLHD